MRLSVVFELLLVFLFLAFAAARVIDKKHAITIQNTKKLRQGPPNRYCACTTNMCNCCRDFSLPVVPVKGPGCASITYLKGDNMMITMSFGDKVLSNTTLVGPKPKPVCMTLPGGISQFCGRIYGLARTDKHFKACLGLELRALDDIEAALRVSCFKFGPKGVSLESAPPVPTDEDNETDDEDDEDDDDDYDLDDEEDDDLIGLGGDLDDDDDDDDDDDGPNAVSGGEGNEVESDSVDYTGFSVLGEDFFGTLFNDEDSKPSTKKKKPSKKTVKPVVQPLRISSTTRRPIPVVKRPTVRPNKFTRKPLKRITKIPRPSLLKLSTTPLPPAPLEVSSFELMPSVSIPPNKISSSTIRTTTTTSTTTLGTTSTSQEFTTAPSINSNKHLSTTEHSTTMPMKHFVTQEMNEIHSTQKITTLPSELYSTEIFPSTKLPDDVINLPDLDVEKIEAIAAIAQQGVTSSVLPSSSLPVMPPDNIALASELIKDEIKTEKYYPTGNTPSLKAESDSNKSTEEDDDDDEDDLLDGIIDDGIDSGDEEDKKSGENENEVIDLNAEGLNWLPPHKAEVNQTEQVEKDEIPITGKPIKVKPLDKEENGEEDNDDIFDGIIGGDDSDERDEYNEKKKTQEDENNEGSKEEEEDILGAFIADPEENDSEKGESDEVTASTDKDRDEEESDEDDDDFLTVLDDDEEDEENDSSEENSAETENTNPVLKIGQGTKQVITESVSAAEAETNGDTDDNTDSPTLKKSSYNDFQNSSSGSEEDRKNDGQTQNVDLDNVITSETQTDSQRELNTTMEASVSNDTKNMNEAGRYEKEPIFTASESEAFAKIKAATKLKEPQALKLNDLLGLRKKSVLERQYNHPISRSRTHRRMNLDRFKPLEHISR